MENSVQTFVDEASPNSSTNNNNNGGWISFPFIIGSMAGLSLAAAGWNNNLIVYLIEEFNMNSVSAAKVYNMANGCSTIFPVLGAVLADSFLGSFSVIWVSSFISLMGVLLLTFTAAMDTLRPPKCIDGSNECGNASTFHLTILYAALALAYLGNGGTRFTIGSMGANQFHKPNHQSIFFNWYTFALYTSNVIGSTVLLYIEDNVSWVIGFAICVAFNIFGLAIFLSGRRFYRHIEAQQESPFMSLARVAVAAIRKHREPLSLGGEDYYNGMTKQDSSTSAHDPTNPSKFFRFLNRAALITEGDKKPDRVTAEPWKLCTVQQVEDLKILIKLFQIWTTGLLLCTPLVIQTSLAILQAMKMDRHLGSNFKIPAGSVIVFTLISTCITITFMDRVVSPLLTKHIRISLTPLQRVGIGHVLTVVSMFLSALVESKRIKLEHQNSVVVPMSVFWLAPQLAISGIGLAFHSPGYAGFYYQEFPGSLKSTSTAVVAVFMGVAFYLGNGVMDLVQRVTGWLPENVNNGRLDNVFWVISVLGALNFVYYVICASLYEYKNVDKEVSDSIDKIDGN